MEGLCFDRKGDLWFCSIYESRVLKLDMKKRTAEEVFRREGFAPVAVKIHKDGRVLVCGIGRGAPGGIVIMQPDGSMQRDLVVDRDVDDLVFDSDGGFYYTWITGSVNAPTGAVCYVSPDFSSDTVYIDHLAMPNGVALSRDEKRLWITELTGGRLLNFPSRKGSGVSSVCYCFTGRDGPDSCSIDAGDNLYVAMYGQGRIMIFNAYGFPVGQVLIPNRDKGHFLCSSHAVVRPHTRELYICAADDIGDEGAWIFKAEGLAVGHDKSYQFL